MVHVAAEGINKSELAVQYLEELIYDCLINKGEPMRASEILECIGGDLPITPKLIRRVMTASDRFSAVDRRWDVAVKFLEKGLPLQQTIQDIVATSGKPVPKEALTKVVAAIIERSDEGTAELVARMTSARDWYFTTERGGIGLRDWLLDLSYTDDEEMRFQNFETDDELQWAEKLASKVKWDATDLVKSSADFLKLAERPVSNKVLSYLCWQAVERFKPIKYFSLMEADARVLLFSGGNWATNGFRVELAAMLKEAAVAAEEMPAEIEPAEEIVEAGPIAPPEVTAEDLNEIHKKLSESKGFVRLPALVEEIFELSPGERGYPEAAEVLRAALTEDERFEWLGTERWRLAGDVPGYVTDIPDMLRVPVLVFETPEGERLDIELEDEGLEGGLAKDVENPLVKDIPVEYDGRVKYVLTYPQFHSGTMPIIGDFFPPEPALVQFTFVDGKGNGYEGWVNNGLGLAFGLEGWYEAADLPVCGAILHVDRTDKPDEYLLDYATGENDPLVYVTPERIAELEEIGEEAGDDWSTFDIIRAIMEDYKKGAQFIALYTEVNIVRRTSPRLVASILSSFHCFYQKQSGTSVWHYDERKLTQGFKKTKRKYIKK